MWCPWEPSFDGVDSPLEGAIMPTDLVVMQRIAREAEAIRLQEDRLAQHLKGMFAELPLHPVDTIDLTVDDLNASD